LPGVQVTQGRGWNSFLQKDGEMEVLAGEQSDPCCYQQSGEPTAAVYSLVEENFCGEGVADER
jgi:hypothetical protein